MIDLLMWWLVSSLIGLAAWPVVWRIFNRLPDRGYGFARLFGLLASSYALWIGASFGLLRNNLAGAWLSVLVLLIPSGWVLRRGRKELWDWTRQNWKIIAGVELLFLLSYVGWSYIRSIDPRIDGTEKPMEFAFLNSILQSPAFPPRDPWLSGYGISYYYFGYIQMALLTRLSGVASGVAFTLTTSSWFAFSCVAAYSLVYNLIQKVGSPRRLLAPLLGPLFVVWLGNLSGLWEMLHSLHVFRGTTWGEGISQFWTRWLNIETLNKPPSALPSIIPQRGGWWWQGSRVVNDVSFTGRHIEVIDEFPFFSFLLADNHPHVLTLPFALMAIAFCLNLFFMGRQEPVGRFRLPINRLQIALAGFIFGGLAFLNTWDFPIYFLLFLLVIFWTVYDRKWWPAILTAARTAIPIVVTAVILYFVWVVSFSSQAGGILPNPAFPTKFSQMFTMFGGLLVPLFIWLYWKYRQRAESEDWKLVWSLAIGIPLAAILIMILLVALIWLLWLAAPDLGVFGGISPFDRLVLALEAPNWREAVSGMVSRRIFALVSSVMVALLVGLGAVILKRHDRQSSDQESPAIFVVMMVVVGAALVLAPEYGYLKDVFATRMNTVFKFYYAAWLLWGIAAAYGVAMYRPEQTGWRFAGRMAMVIVISLAALYPVFALITKLNNQSKARTLDGELFYSQYLPEVYEAAHWLEDQMPLGVVAEAVGSSYQRTSVVSMMTGFPTVLGWEGHEVQWRGGGELQAGRSEAIRLLYQTRDADEARRVIETYGIDYVFVGTIELGQYAPVREEKFLTFMDLIFDNGIVRIYMVRSGGMP
jgi:YYY domain-containing protein